MRERRRPLPRDQAREHKNSSGFIAASAASHRLLRRISRGEPQRHLSPVDRQARHAVEPNAELKSEPAGTGSCSARSVARRFAWVLAGYAALWLTGCVRLDDQLQQHRETL